MTEKDEDQETFEVAPDAARRARLVLSRAQSFSLLIYSRDGANLVTLPLEGALVIGRDEPATHIVREKSLSREHARFSSSGGELWVTDVGSTNGTFIGGNKIERTKLSPGDEVMLGNVLVSVHRLRPAQASSFGLESDDTFRAHLEAELVRARYFGRACAVLMAKGPQLDRWSPAVKAALAPVDHVALYALDTLELLLPEASYERASNVAAQVTKLAANVVVGGAFFPGSGTSADALIEAARTAAFTASMQDRVRLEKLPLSPVVQLDEDSVRLPPAGAAMRALYEVVERVARSNVGALVVGETGAGKEVVARSIHTSSKRAGRPLVAVSCAAIPAQLVESTLFGHEKGAFTGANERRKGAFEAADGGTLFLDEVGELPLPVQATLLRAIELKRFSRVGATEEVSVDVRLVAATNRDLEAMVEAGTFRSDLLYRINTVVIRVPPLRDRAEDIGPLAKYFVKKAAAAHGSTVADIDDEAVALLERYAWPGNVRELKNAIERAVVLASADVLTTDDLPERVRQVARAQAPSTEDLGDHTAAGGDGDLRKKLTSYETELIRATLESTGGNQTEAAKALGIPRRTLVHKLRALGLRARDEAD